ncbi:aminotransferase class III-fold pyridoxal phosphate-dependent enzyme [Candidatus Bathyarchaeota archaeon]|nr:aminotransferase class III-fold pyridoxal phosphate-dependent enzyme [Candidatus Bathyarchaeota archaeon]
MQSLSAPLRSQDIPAVIPLIRTQIPGEKSRELLKAQSELETRSVIYPKSFPIAIKRIYDSIIEDADGNFLIDWVTGISVLNLGYSDIIKEAVSGQLSKTWHNLELPTETRIEFLRQVKKSFPDNMQNYRTLFGISGADACETAINMAHLVSGKPTASTIAFEGAYHGVSGGIVAATAGNNYRTPVYCRGFNIVRAPYPYEKWYHYDSNATLAFLEKVMMDPEAGYDRPDSLIVEPIQGEGGYIVPPDGFLRSIREFCDAHDLIMIVDEVQTGVGRTGRMWGFEWDGIKPDIVCASKSIGGGIPISIIYYREDYDSKLPSPFHLGTYRANPLAMAAGTAVLREVPRHLDRVRVEGEKLRDAFVSIGSSLIADVRGRGFMIGVELVENEKPLDKSRIMEIKHSNLRRGLMMHTCGHFGNVFRFMGALNIPSGYLDTGVRIFEESLRAYGGKDRKTG